MKGVWNSVRLPLLASHSAQPEPRPEDCTRREPGQASPSRRKEPTSPFSYHAFQWTASRRQHHPWAPSTGPPAPPRPPDHLPGRRPVLETRRPKPRSRRGTACPRDVPASSSRPPKAALTQWYLTTVRRAHQGSCGLRLLRCDPFRLSRIAQWLRWRDDGFRTLMRNRRIWIGYRRPQGPQWPSFTDRGSKASAFGHTSPLAFHLIGRATRPLGGSLQKAAHRLRLVGLDPPHRHGQHHYQRQACASEGGPKRATYLRVRMGGNSWVEFHPRSNGIPKQESFHSLWTE